MMLRNSVVRVVRHQLVVEFVNKFVRSIQGYVLGCLLDRQSVW
jgi:hypothetical protein